MPGIDKNTLIYLRGDSFVDLSLNNYTITNSSSMAAVDSTHFGKAIDFTVASKRLEALNAVLPTNQFTIDWWELSKGASTANTALVSTLDNTHTNTAIKGIIMGKASSSAAPCLWATTPSQTGTWVVSQNVFGNVNTTSWVHRALVYDGANFYAYENGVLFKTMACAGLAAPSPSHIIIGGYRAQTACYNAHVESLRISNNIRWTGNFTPPTKPYTSVTVNVLGQIGNAINFSATKNSINESITRVDVLLNNAVVQSYTSNYDNISCELTNLAETNNVEIRAYYYKDFYESKSFSFVPAMEKPEKLESNISLSKIVDKISELQSYYSSINNNLINYFNNEGVEVAETEKTFSQLISKLESYSSSSGGEKAELEAEREELNNQIATLTSQVAPLETQVSSLNSQVSSLNSQISSLNNEQSSAKSTLVSKLTSCGVSASTSTDFNTLLNNIGMAITKGSENGTGGGSGNGGSGSGGSGSGPTGSTSGFTVSVTNSWTYGFYKSGSWYYNDNCDPNDYGDYDSSYAMCKITITNSSGYYLYFNYTISSEEDFDIGLLSTRNGSLSASTTVDSSYLLKVSGSASSYVSLSNYTSGTYYVKYRKDGSVADGSDQFSWRITR